MEPGTTKPTPVTEKNKTPEACESLQFHAAANGALDAEKPFDPNARPIGELLAELFAGVPDEEWAKLPQDFALNAEHYLYGSPKE